MNKTALSLATLILLVQLAAAGTVTFTGTCGNYVPSSGTLGFRLSNSGNDSAYNLVLTPHIQNAQITNSIYTVSNLGPASSASLNISISKLLQKGVAVVYFTAAYQQSSSVFTAVFPCLVSFVNVTTSQVLLSANSSVSSNNNATAKVRVFNAGTTPVSVNVSLILPPTFTYRSSGFSVVSLGPYQVTNVTFSLGFPVGTQAAYAVGVAGSYSAGNLSYSSLATFIMQSPKQATASLGSLLIWAATAVVTVVILLLIISMLRKKPRPMTQEPAGRV